MKNKRQTLKGTLFCWLACCFIACGNDSSEPFVPASIVVKTKTMEVTKAENEIDIEVEASLENWTFTCDADWCHPQQTRSGLHLLVEANRTGKERTATVKLKVGTGDNKAEDAFVLTQLTTADVNILSLEQDSIYFDYQGGTLRVAVKGNSKLTGVSVPAAYQKYFRAVATGGTVTVIASSNEVLEPQVTDLTVLAGEKKGRLRVCLDFKKKQLFEIYSFNGHKAMVYKVNPDGTGMAVSVDEFASADFWGMGVRGWKAADGSELYGATACWNYGGNNTVSGTTRSDGQKNMNQWRETHRELMAKNLPENNDPDHFPFAPCLYDSPAFLWCEFKNTDGKADWYKRESSVKLWYLPSVGDLLEIAALYQGNVERMNNLFLDNRGSKMGSELWSSSETADRAFYVDMVEGIEQQSSQLGKIRAVRAVVAFVK